MIAKLAQASGSRSNAARYRAMDSPGVGQNEKRGWPPVWLCQLAQGRGYVEHQGAVYLVPPAAVEKLHQAQQAIAASLNAPFLPSARQRVARSRAAELQETLENLSPAFRPPEAWRAHSDALRQLTQLAPAPLAADPARAEALRARGAEVLTLPAIAGRIDLAALLAELAQRGVNEVHVEGGPRLSGALLSAGLVDELLLYLAPSLLGDQACGLFSVPALTSLAEKQSLRWQDVRRVGDDLRILARLSA